MRAAGLVIVIGWLAFWTYWLISARNLKSGQNQRSRHVGIHLAVIVLLVLLVRFVGLGRHKAKEDWALAAAGLAVWLLGLALAVWARRCIGMNWGMPMTRKDDPDLVTTGPYRFIRHPIYAGVILGAAGTALVITLDGLIAVAVLAGYFVYSAVKEERYLAGLFPDAYPAYKARSKMLIPFIF